MAVQPFQLVMQKGPNPGKVFELTVDEIIIGRDIGNRIVINDPEVSRKHARLTSQATGYIIEDLGSTNGTFVNGQRLMGPHMLRQGETIMFGEKINLVYETVGEDPNATLIHAAPPPAPRETVRVSQPEYSSNPPAPQPITPPPVYQAPPQPVYQQPSPQPYQPEPVYSGQASSAPAEPYYQPIEAYEYQEEQQPNKSRKWIYIGCGCLIIVLCCIVASAFAFDTLNLYCEPPFDVLFSC